MTHWNILDTDANLPLMSHVLGVCETTARVMANRGIRSKKSALAYLSPTLQSLRDPLLMKDAEAAVKHILDAVARREKMMIYGDYDVDGVMGTVILFKTLRHLGAAVDYYIPHRSEEGYGLNRDAVDRIKAAGVSLIITVDNGIAAVAEINHAHALGMRVVVIDHHEPGFVAAEGERQEVLPEALAVVDPKQAACPYPFKHLCAAGLSFKLAGALHRRAGVPFTQEAELLALASIATVCDIVDLQDENRVIVKQGLAVLNHNKQVNPGLGTLIVRRGYGDKPIDTYVAGFVLGPCINATGRLESAALSVQLMLATEDAERHALAQKLMELNDERKNITTDSVNRVLEGLAACDKLDKVLVLTDYETHESVAGIVAGRVKDTFHRPVIMLTRGDAAIKGSGRSIEAYNLFDALNKHRHLFLRFGGHAMAAGLTLPEAHVPVLRACLNEDCPLTENDFHPVLTLDGALAAEAVTLALSDELARLAPFGRGNREPLFVSYGLHVEGLRAIKEKNTLIFTFSNRGVGLKGICFGLYDTFVRALSELCREDECHALLSGRVREAGLVMDAVYGIETNVYNGRASVQLRIKDFKLHH